MSETQTCDEHDWWCHCDAAYRAARAAGLPGRQLAVEVRVAGSKSSLQPLVSI